MRERESAERLVLLYQCDGQGHGLTVHMTGKTSWLAVRSFLSANRASVLSGISAGEIEIAVTVQRQLMIDRTMSAVKLNLCHLIGDLKSNMVTTPGPGSQLIGFLIWLAIH
jgi:hypothetical protein